MNHPNLESELRVLLKERLQLDVSSLDRDADLVHNLGLDSLMKLQLLAVLETHLHVCFPDGQLATLRTLRQIMEAIQQIRDQEVGAL